MNKEIYKKQIEKRAGIASIAGKFLASNVGKSAVKGAGKAAISGAIIGAASPVQKNQDGTKGSRIKNAVGGAIGGAVTGGIMSGAGSALKSSLANKPTTALKQPVLASSNLPTLNNSSRAPMTQGPKVLPDGTIKVAREELHRSYLQKQGIGV